MTARIVATGMSSTLRYFEALPDVAEQAAVLAVNQVAERDGLALMKRTMRNEVEFPGGYLEQSSRLRVTRRATRASIEAAITARDRPTSLARFARGQTVASTRRAGGVRVTVKKGKSKTLPKAFLVNLKNGNTGLAIRLPAGQRPEATQKAQRLGANLWLLYGPSVEQVFRGVAVDQSPALGEMVSKQFLRQFARLARG